MSQHLYWSLIVGCAVLTAMFFQPAWRVLSTTSLPGEVQAANHSRGFSILPKMRAAVSLGGPASLEGDPVAQVQGATDPSAEAHY